MYPCGHQQKSEKNSKAAVNSKPITDLYLPAYMVVLLSLHDICWFSWCIRSLYLINEIRSFKNSWPIKHCKGTLHLKYQSAPHTEYRCTHIFIGLNLYINRVHDIIVTGSLPFQFHQHRPADKLFAAKTISYKFAKNWNLFLLQTSIASYPEHYSTGFLHILF